MSKRQAVALSTTEVEYMAATHASKEAVWLQRLCSGIGLVQQAVRLDCDSQSAIFLAKNPAYRECWVCVIFFACVCVGASDMTTASDDPSSSALCVVCAGRFPRGVPGGAGMPPLGYAQRSATGGSPRAAPRNFFLGGFCYF
jgi:hypothetical protein